MIPNFFKNKLTVALTEGGSETTVYVDSLNSQTGEEISWANFSPFTKGFITIDSEQNGTNNRFSEVISFTGIDTVNKAFTGCTRGLSAFGDTTVTANKTYHPIGSDVILSLTGQMVDQIVDTIPNLSGAVDSVNGQTGVVVLDADDISDSTTTNKFATAAEKTKLGHITVTQAVNLDTIESDTATNNAKVSNATHTGDVTGATALTIANDVVTNAKMANMATKTYKGRTSAGTGDPEDVAVATLKTDLALTKSDVGLGNVDNTSDATKNSAVATLTNKTFNLTSNTLTGTIAQFNAALSDGDFATLAGSETLTNKTIDGANNTITNTTGYIQLLNSAGSSTTAMAASTTYYFGTLSVNFFPGTGATTHRVFFPKAGTIKKIYTVFRTGSGTPSSAETVSLYVRVDNTTDYTIGTGFRTDVANTVYFDAQTTNISVAEASYVNIKMVTPAWTTVANYPFVEVRLYIE